MTIPVIDVFAGPGGLNEGFSSIADDAGLQRFSTVASFEMDPWACETLRLRATFRSLRAAADGMPRAYVDLLMGRISLPEFFARDEVEIHAKEAFAEVQQLELGEATRKQSDDVIRQRLAGELQNWVLIGGPPCQAYSLAGRSRRAGDPSFKDDHKHILYREYLNIIAKFEPAVFVMENVKGMLSSQHEGGPIFGRIKEDLEAPRVGLRYELRSLVVPRAAADLTPSDFVIRAEEHGIPQRRHRVILLGIREDLAARQSAVLQKQSPVSLRSAIGDLPAVRSRLSPLSSDSPSAWHEARLVAAALAEAQSPHATSIPRFQGARWLDYRPRLDGELGEWLVDRSLDGVSLHEARRHMRGDLERYAYLSYMAGQGSFPKVMDLPSHLAPNHRNASRADAPFADRFRVQPWDSPSTTVVSHIAKDGHYYIHPDPLQMRSLTVREAARLQTFPDNYLFVGNRTQQYHQVGNAVPPLLARKIGEIVHALIDGEPAPLGKLSPAS
ncbi:DNA cytosine methyltransferase [Nocardioides baculatus]|uniref:DNA (cytosine-5-)-methyltransferase n=1 Tax=Nocardioides baculatus TaxID=2801337 RepID=A0ABS1LCH7_9ACTN|nr:DNA cytosine methyltransferase [Nocardioides baculatus]MBL0749252.1 DNA cytosine methyltransferase [Nocardioides baculatus]